MPAKLILLLTLSRLSLAALLVSVLDKSFPLILAALLLLITADIADGVVARRIKGDSNLRRVADSTIDVISVHAVLIAFVRSHPSLILLYLPLLFRDTLVAGACVILFIRSHAITVTGSGHKLSSLSKAFFFISLIGSYSLFTAGATSLSWILNFVLMFDYLGLLLLPLTRLPIRGGRIELQSYQGLTALRTKFGLPSHRPVQLLAKLSFRRL